MPKVMSICALLLLVTGCASGGDKELDRQPIAAAWTADVQAEVGFEPAGFATVTIMPDGETRANLTLRGGTQGGNHPWHIHEGLCPAGDSEPSPVGAEVGSPDTYPVLAPNERGSASATASLRVLLERDGEYHVDVHESRDDDSVVACGDLEEMG